MPDGVLLVAHGSRSTAGQAEMETLAGLVVDACAGIDVRLGYLELSRPPAAAVLDTMVRDGLRDIVAVPLMLHAAGHAKSDVPAVVVEGRARHPQAAITYARPLGVDHALLVRGQRRLADADALGLPLALLSRGTSDPDANAEAYRVGRLLADMAGSPLVVAGFAGVTWPSVPDALDQLRRLGAERIAAFAWFMATGVLVERMREQYAEFTRATGIDVVDAGYLGAGPELAELVVARMDEAAAGAVTVNCDTCVYRVPFPGLEDRVGLPVGAGHSHLAAEHRHDAHHHSHTANGT